MRVIPGLSAGITTLQTVVVVIPHAVVLSVGDIPRGEIGVFHRQIFVYGLTRNASHHMHAEFQTKLMHRIGERAEPFAFGGAWKTTFVGQLPAVFIDA